jgi:hypothetical protein
MLGLIAFITTSPPCEKEKIRNLIKQVIYHVVMHSAKPRTLSNHMGIPVVHHTFKKMLEIAFTYLEESPPKKSKVEPSSLVFFFEKFSKLPHLFLQSGYHIFFERTIGLQYLSPGGSDAAGSMVSYSISSRQGARSRMQQSDVT